MKVDNFKKLIVWQRSMELVKEVYRLTRKLPKTELFGLVSQMQRASVSIPSNIAEGFGRGHAKEFSQFVSIAFGSAMELETQLIICQEEYKGIEIGKTLMLLDEVQKMLRSFKSKIN